MKGALEQARWLELEPHLDECEACRSMLFAALDGAEPSRPLPNLDTQLLAAALGSAPVLARLTPGDLLSGKYRIEALVGRGGMGEVFAAFHQQLERRVAIKVLRHSAAAASARFLREAQACARLGNEHVVRIFDLGELGSGEPYIVMEYLTGEDLSQVLRRGPLAIQLAADYLAQACDALCEAHTAGVIHRDLKPANLFLSLTPDGRRILKVLDFGISKYKSASVGVETEQGALIGTPLYMSPEQLQSSHEVDERSDIWSLGVILYELLTGRAPFAAAALPALMAAISLRAPERPSSFRSGLPSELEDVILRCLEKDRAARFPSVAALRSAIAPFCTEPRLSVGESSSPAAGAPLLAAQSVFVGREREREQLGVRWEKAARGAGSLVFVSGEAGIGKTSLIEHLRDLAQSARPAWYESVGRCLEHSGSSEPYLPFLDAIGGLLSGSGGQLVRTLLRRHAPSWCVPLSGFFEAEPGFDELRRDAAGGSRERMLRELADLLSALAEERPLLLVLEDLHWADPSSLDQLRLLCQRCGNRRWLIVGSFRSQQLEANNPPLARLRADLVGSGGASELALTGFSSHELSAYLAARFSTHALPSSFVERLAARTEGQPLFVARLLDMLEERALLERRDGVWQIHGPAAAVTSEVPQSLSLVLHRTLAAVGSEEHRTLQYASVQGVEFDSEPLRQVLGEHLLELEERLARIAKSTGLVIALGEEQASPSRYFTRYRFSHALYQEHLYAELTRARRRELHRGTAEALLALWGEAKAPLLALGRHWEEAGNPVLASQYLLAASERAERIFAYGEARQLCQRALGMLAPMPEDERPPHYTRLQERLAWITYELRDFVATDGAFSALLQEGERRRDSELQIEALHGLCFSMLQSRRFGSVEPYVERALQLAVATGNLPRQSEMLALRGVRLANLDEYGPAVQVLEQSLAIAWKLNHQRALELGVDCLAFVHHCQGNYVGSEEQSRLALTLPLHPRVVIANTFRLGLALLRLGRIAEGFAQLEVATELARRKVQKLSLLSFPTSRGAILRELGSPARALELHRGVLPELEQGSRSDGDRDPGIRVVHARCLIQIALDLLSLQQPGAAAEALAQAELLRRDDTRSISYGHPGCEDGSDLELARLELQLPTHDAEPLLRRAGCLLEDMRRRDLYDQQVHTHWLQARILQRSGDTRAALEFSAQALELLRCYPLPLIEWKIQALRSELHDSAGQNDDAALAARAAAQTLGWIAQNIADAELRAAFLGAPEARRVLARS